MAGNEVRASSGTRAHAKGGLSSWAGCVSQFATSEIQHVVRWPVSDGVRPGVPPLHESRARSGGRTESRAWESLC